MRWHNYSTIYHFLGNYNFNVWNGTNFNAWVVGWNSRGLSFQKAFFVACIPNIVCCYLCSSSEMEYQIACFLFNGETEWLIQTLEKDVFTYWTIHTTCYNGNLSFNIIHQFTHPTYPLQSSLQLCEIWTSRWKKLSQCLHQELIIGWQFLIDISTCTREGVLILLYITGVSTCWVHAMFLFSVYCIE